MVTTMEDASPPPPTLQQAPEQPQHLQQLFIQYNPRKPKWWKRLTRDGQSTKGQRRATRFVLYHGDHDDVFDDGDDFGDGDDQNDGSHQRSKNATKTASATSRGLALPSVPYGSVLDWYKDVFREEDDQDRNGDDDDDDDIWLELGFGRGENLLALLHQKEGLELDLGRNQQRVLSSSSSPSHPRRLFRLVGCEIHSPGIGILCQRIRQAWMTYDDSKNNNKVAAIDATRETSDDGDTIYDDADNDDAYWKDYTLYSPEIDPYTPKNSDAKNNDETTRETTIPPVPPRLPRPRRRPPPRHRPYSSSLRIHAGDGYKLLPKLPDNSLGAILVTFPDPFPTEAEKPWRLIQVQTLLEFHRILRKSNTKILEVAGGGGGEREGSTTKDTEEERNGNNDDDAGRFYLATDDAIYHEWCHEMIRQVNRHHSQSLFDGKQAQPVTVGAAAPPPPPSALPLLFSEVIPCPDRRHWLPAVSTYEQKGWDEGRSTKLSCWRVA